jgi:hypothetical protein
MNSATDTMVASRPYVRLLIACYLLLFLGDIWILVGTPVRPAAMAVMGMLFIIGIGILLGSIGILKAGREQVAVRWLIAGWAFIIGGVTFDIAATLIHTPDLANEMNPIARLLLDSNYSLAFVYAYSALMQTIIVVDLCILWAVFLRHRRSWMEESFCRDGRSFGRFIKTATGGGQLTWRQWLLPCSPRELPRGYEICLIVIPLLMVGTVARWYYGFQWFGILPWMSNLALFVILAVIALAVLAGWLYWEYQGCRRLLPVSREAPSFEQRSE